MKQFLAGIFTGAVIALLLASRIIMFTEKAPEQVEVTQLSGEKITHQKFEYTGQSVKFNTQAAGKGEILTVIPKVNIPEARAWLQKKHGVMFEGILIDRRIYGVSYMKRYNSFSLGTGILFSESSFEGIKIQGQYWFSL